MSYESAIELRKFVSPEIILGIDARLLIGRYIGHFGSKKPMIVTDANIKELPWFYDIIQEISCYAPEYVLFSDVTTNPKDYEAMSGSALFIEKGCDLIIAVGGGSPMDCAKCISIVSSNFGHILDYEGVDKIALPGPPLICIPSTSGTSADVSQFAIIMDTNSQIKKAIISKKVVPDLALIDPVPLLTMDPYLTAYTGMDALTHAIEAYVSNAQSALTDVHALEAIKLITFNLIDAQKEDRDVNVLYQMMLGSLQAGLAFSNASLGAVHAMAHSLGGLYDLPHGECNSILLEHVINANFISSSDRYKTIAQIMGIVTDNLNMSEIRQQLLIKISELRKCSCIKPFIQIDHLDINTLDLLVENALDDPCMVTNPIQLSNQEVRLLYEKVIRTEE